MSWGCFESLYDTWPRHHQNIRYRAHGVEGYQEAVGTGCQQAHVALNVYTDRGITVLSWA